MESESARGFAWGLGKMTSDLGGSESRGWWGKEKRQTGET